MAVDRVNFTLTFMLGLHVTLHYAFSNFINNFLSPIHSGVDMLSENPANPSPGALL